MKTLFVLVLFLFSHSLFSQSFSEKWVHGYLDFGYEERSFTNHLSSGVLFANERSEFGFRNFLPGIFKMRKSGVYHEISLTRLQFRVEDDVNKTIIPPVVEPYDGERVRTTGLGFQLESGIATPNWLAGFFRPAIGLGAVPEFSCFRHTPKVSNRFPYRNFSVLLGLNVVPRLHFRISERIALMAVVPVHLAGVEFQFEKMEDPRVPEAEQSVNTVGFEIAPHLHLARLGTAILL